MNVITIRGHRLGALQKKMSPYLAKGYTVQGAIAQETGWGGSKRYVATLVYNPPEANYPHHGYPVGIPEQQPTQTVPEYERGWWDGQRELLRALSEGRITVETALYNMAMRS